MYVISGEVMSLIFPFHAGVVIHRNVILCVVKKCTTSVGNPTRWVDSEMSRLIKKWIHIYFKTPNSGLFLYFNCLETKLHK